MIYHSKIDPFIGVVMTLGLGAGIIGTVLPIMFQHDWRGVIPAGIIFGGVFLVMFPLYYEIADAELYIRSGLMRWHIPFRSILRVQPSHNVLSSPALSLDRLEVAYEKNGSVKKLLISPKDAEGFLRDLRMRAPQLQSAGQDLAVPGVYVPL